MRGQLHAEDRPELGAVSARLQFPSSGSSPVAFTDDYPLFTACLLSPGSWFLHPERPYRMMTPQAIRAPALPAGSVFPSSGFS